MHKMATRSKHNNHDLYADWEKIRHVFAETASDIKGKSTDYLTQSMDNVKDKSLQTKDNIAHYTAEKPFKSLGIALLVGIALGYFIHK